MTPTEMAALHAVCFTNTRPWGRAEFESLCAQKHTKTFCLPSGFALIQVIADEAEILTIAIAPQAQRRGIGTLLCKKISEDCGKNGVTKIFLEVAADNHKARGLYQKLGYREIARRAGYYTSGREVAQDAIILAQNLTSVAKII
ncbi:alanine acetyltransferase [Amylibacter marinus]|uniref:[Ribosomal protein bS18]-alanine N-acetyltransferase n=1 Tax=Amylibacter marinus TaxID=1475483 RepID=A0ABQ5VT91_9RHOB|nr:ribosomal protein S18-alanine N-acetyltransferase [Amylibacter marinus]GLQ34496.1 alanine acetyltransferase [Amylibacter marinus]